MDPRFLEVYEQELRYLREVGGEFARQFPKIAARLGLDGFECADPYVERLLEGSAFLAARVRLRMDAEFPRFTQQLLEALYPHYLMPTPSMAIVQFQPDLTEGALAEGFRIPRDTVLRSLLRKGEITPCLYRTAHDIQLWPLAVEQAEYVPSAALLPEIEPLPGQAPAKAGIRLRLRTHAGLRFNELALDTLEFYLRGTTSVPMRLYERLLASTVGIAARAGDSNRKSDWIVQHQTRVLPRGFTPEDALLPPGLRSFEGYRLLHEYFAFPQRFLFVQVPHLRRIVRQTVATTLDVVILLDRADPALERQVDAGLFALHCTPAINLFPQRLDRVHLTATAHEYHLIPDRTRPLDFEIATLRSVIGYGAATEPEREFLPFYHVTHADARLVPQAYYTIRREPRLLSARRLQNNLGPRSSYIGTEVFIALVDAAQAPFSPDLRQLGVEALCTNRDLPLLMSLGGGSTDFTWDFSGPVESVRCVAGPSKPRPPPPEGELHWRLISHLSLNYLSLTDMGETRGAAAVRELLGLYAFLYEPHLRQEVQGVVAVRAEPVYRRWRMPQGSAFVRGLRVTVELDESLFEGTGCFLFGAVLEQFFSKYVSINSFAETVLRTTERGQIMLWPPRQGRRPIL